MILFCNKGDLTTRQKLIKAFSMPENKVSVTPNGKQGNISL
jgi:hypothetical protein